MNKIVARYADGRMVKGTTVDFFPTKDLFHVSVAENGGTRLVEVSLKELKALFFVRDFSGNPKHVQSNEFDSSKPAPGRKLKVVFSDGEVLVGTTTGYQPGRPGFFIVPADTAANTERCYIVTAHTREVTFI
ncbi:MAG TPA: hypothetical protein DGF30_11550 [Desulfomicrobium sp.]|nr:hypothetical protein [Desulfomicrobium sp.]